MEKQKFGEFLRKTRKSLGITITELCKDAGISNAYLSQIETGERGVPELDIIFKLADSLGICRDELIEKTDKYNELYKNEGIVKDLFVIVCHTITSQRYLFKCNDFPNIKKGDLLLTITSKGEQQAVALCSPQPLKNDHFTDLILEKFGTRREVIKDVIGVYELKRIPNKLLEFDVTSAKEVENIER